MPPIQIAPATKLWPTPWLGAGVLALCLCLAAPMAQALTAFAPTQVVGGNTLLLHGAGTRYRAFFQVYDMAMYTPARVNTAEQLVAMPGPKRLNFVALREVSGTDMGMAFIKGLQTNARKEQVNRHMASTNRLVEIFSGKSKLMPGDTFAMEFIPGKGTSFFITGKAQGDPVGDAEFFNLVLGIWLGNSPVDWKLKDALLGVKS